MSTHTTGGDDETLARLAVGVGLSLPAGLLLNLNLGAASMAANGAQPSPSLDSGFLVRAAAWSLFLVALAAVAVLWRSKSILSTARRGAWLIGSMCLLMIPLAQPAIEFVAACGRITIEQQAVQLIPFATTIASETVVGLAIAGSVLCACVLLALRLSVRSVRVAGGLSCVLWASLAQAQECPVVPELPLHSLEKVFQGWVAAKDPMKAAVEIRQIAKNGALELQAAGEVRVLPQDTVHYRLREASPRRQATDSKPDAAEVAVDFYRRGPVVVILSNGSPRKVALTDCRAGEPRAPAAAGGGNALTVLEAAVGGTEGEARARARLVQWVVFIADPRRIRPEGGERDIGGYGGSKMEAFVPIPRERQIALTSAVQVNDASLTLSASLGGSVTEALVRLHCAGNRAEEFSDHYFDTSIGYLRIDKATELDVPPDVEALLQPAAAGK